MITAFGSIEVILKSQDATLANVVDMTIFLTDMNHYGAMNEVGTKPSHC